MTAKASEGKPFAGRSPGEVDRALRDRNLPEEQRLIICSHVNVELKSETKNKTRNQKQSSTQTSLEASPSPGYSKPRSPFAYNLPPLRKYRNPPEENL